jgi:hypothetical protein
MAMERLAKTDLPPGVKIIDANKLEKLSIPFFMKVEVYGKGGAGKNFFNVSQVVDTKSIFSYIAQMLKSEAGDEYVSKVILSMPSDDYDLEELFLETYGELGEYSHLKKATYLIHLDVRDSRISEDYLAELISALDGGVLANGVLTRLRMGDFGLFGRVSFSDTIKNNDSSKRHTKPMHLGDFVRLSVQEARDYWMSTNIPDSLSNVKVDLKLSESMHFTPKDDDIRKHLFILDFYFRLENSVDSFGEKLYGKSLLSNFSSLVFYKGNLALKIDSILVKKINKVYSNEGTKKHVFHVKGNIEMVPLLVVAEGFQESRLSIKTTHDYEGSKGFFFSISRDISYFPVVREGEKGMSVEVFDRSEGVSRSITLRSFSKLTGDFLKAMGKFSGKFVESALAKPLEEMVNFLAQGVELCVSGRRVRVFPLSNTLSEVSPEKLREQIRSSLKEFLEKRKIAYSKAVLDMLSSNLSESFFSLYRQEENGKFRFVPYYVSRENNGIYSSFTFLRANGEGAGEIFTTIAVNIVPSEEASKDKVLVAYSPIFRTLERICPRVKLRFHTYA